MSNFNAGAIISLDEAQLLVKAFQEKFPNEIKSSLIDADLVLQLLKQEDCVGLRIYNGYNSDAKRLSPVLVGVNSKKEDMTWGVILDRSSPCPTDCPITSALMQ